MSIRGLFLNPRFLFSFFRKPFFSSSSLPFYSTTDRANEQVDLEQNPSQDSFDQSLSFFESRKTTRTTTVTTSTTRSTVREFYQEEMAASASKSSTSSSREQKAREFLHLEADAAGEREKTIRVMSYNVLSAASADSGFFATPAEWLRFSYRSKEIVKEVEEYEPAILCLQEADNIKEWYGPALAKLHMDHVHVCRSGKVDGEGVWFDRRRWFCRASTPVYFDQLEEIARKKGHDNPSYFSTPNVAIIVALEALEPEDSDHPSLLVVSLHLWWKPEDGMLRLSQIRYLFQCLARFREDQKIPAEVPVLLAGDFNSRPASKLYTLVTNQGFVSAYTHYPFNPQEIRTKRTPKEEKAHSTDLPIPEAPFTSVNGARTETIDYIFYQPTHFRPLRLLDVPDLSKTLTMPDHLFPSDHLPIVVDFKCILPTH